MIKFAVTYCRVSSAKQVKEGHGLSSQETRCREYARHKGYEVIETFFDEGISGSLIERPGMQSMLGFLRKRKGEIIAVIIDDISRLARGLEAHLDLRTSIGAAGGKLESPSIEFGEDSDSILVENLLASVSQHQRQKNAEQVKNRMRARVMNGYWTGKAPYGYRYKSMPNHGKLLVRDEPLASIVQEALEGYACGRFETRPEIKYFLESHAVFPRGYNGRVHYQRVDDMLNNALYAGYVHFPRWDVHFQPGKHEAIISLETWQKVQDRLKGQAKAPARVDVHDDFPLRGFVVCACCGQPMTACWSRGRKKAYPYYLCQTKGCSEYKKSVRKEKLETEFEILLKSLCPSEDMFKIAVEALKDHWREGEKNLGQESMLAKKELAEVEKKVGQLMDRIVSTDSPSVIKAYEEHIKNLEMRKAGLAEIAKNCGRPLKPFDQTYRTALEFLRNPQKLWVSERIEDKRIVLKLVFAKPLEYCQNGGYRTALTSCPFTLFRGFSTPNKVLVEPRGIEPLTSTMPLLRSPS